MSSAITWANVIYLIDYALSARKDVSLLPCNTISDTDFLENTLSSGRDAITVS